MARPLLFSLSLLAASGLNAQTTALDFTLDDCAGTSHHLFDELDQGKIVILEFAMIPTCSPCILAGNELQAIVADYEITNPGTVKYYAWGYNDAYTCAQMASWESVNGLEPSATFIDGSAMVTYYGGMGMPTVVILSGADHEVIFQQMSFTQSLDDNVIAAIDAELALTVHDAGMPDLDVTLAPNPAASAMAVEMSLPGATDVVLTIFDATGRSVMHRNAGSFSGGQHTLSVAVNELMNGRYVMVLSGAFGERRMPFEVLH